jgi:hypothetical protein
MTNQRELPLASLSSQATNFMVITSRRLDRIVVGDTSDRR